MPSVSEAIAGAALSALFDVLLGKLKSWELFNLTTEGQVRSEIKKWEKMLRKLQIVLEDAEEKQIADRNVKSWLVELKHLASDVEDILDEFSTECLRRKVNGQLQEASPSKFYYLHSCLDLIHACLTTFTPRAVMFNSNVMFKVKEITDRFNSILEEMKMLNLIGNVLATTPELVFARGATMYRRDGDKDKIIELLEYKTGDAKIGGMGGLGPPESVLDWTQEVDSELSNQNANNQAFSGEHWRLLQCQNGLHIFEELLEVDYLPRSCSRAMKAVGVVEATCEEIFELVMSMDGTRFEWDCSFLYGRLVEEVDEHTSILYHRLKLDWFPMVVWPRDLCYVRYWRRNDDGSYDVLFQSRENENCVPRPGRVRAHV